ncbi:MAG: cysteine desulfurase NifS [Candidatus Aenigmarchaeota archaeon ex4484_56]|nr:MAG: cysteine desulfurase NifS [Candidatus Aenigmarchaeota archaeon ex4484_56]
MRRIYLDHAATTPTDREVIETMQPCFNKKFGNASSIHYFGREAKEALEKAREIISKKINCEVEELIFTSGGTESNNLALIGTSFANKDKGNHIITSKIEHESILNCCKWLEKQGFEITYLSVDKYGFIDLEELEKAIRKDTILVSIMHANNEIGTIEPIEEIGKICRKYDVYFHTDACQSFTKVPIDIKKQNIDLMTINSHKIYGPKGIGALYINKDIRTEPLHHGGGHERNLRSGTENIPGIVGFAKAVEIAKEKDIIYMRKLRDKLIKNILEIPNTKLNGHPIKRLCNNANFSFSYVEGESLVLRLDSRGIACSTGSACSSHTLKPSHVLLAIGLKPEEAHSSLRINLGKENTEEEIDYTISSIKEEVENLRKISPW